VRTPTEARASRWGESSKKGTERAVFNYILFLRYTCGRDTKSSEPLRTIATRVADIDWLQQSAIGRQPLLTMPPKRSESKGIQKKKKVGKNTDAWTSDADANRDGKVSRSEAKLAGITVSAKDLNEDGRVLRSETRRVARTKLK
jgi:hypothetical protein